jgi:8-oxo-dGTP pyrophosphatase MutT (NUDIX family)
MTGGNEMELWDAYKADGTLAGSTLVRGEKIPGGLRHAVAEVFVLHKDDSILLMQRDKNKPGYPGYWESGAGGAVLKGENFELGARRELLEETGIIAGELELIYKEVTDNTIFKGYLCRTNVAKDSVQLQEGETIDYKWVTKQEFREIFESEEFVTSLKDRLADFVKTVLQ